MVWYLAVLVVYLDTISNWFIAMGVLFIFFPLIYWVSFAIQWNGIYWSEIYGESSQKKKEITAEKYTPMIKQCFKKTKIHVSIGIVLLFISSAIPSPQILFKMVALKYGTDAAFSPEAKNIGNKIYESMDKSLSILNQKLDDLNMIKKGKEKN